MSAKINSFPLNTDRKDIAEKVARIDSDQWVPMPDNFLFVSCCDCSLSHLIEVRRTGDGVIEIRYERDDELTKQVRRRRGCTSF